MYCVQQSREHNHIGKQGEHKVAAESSRKETDLERRVVDDNVPVVRRPLEIAQVLRVNGEVLQARRTETGSGGSGPVKVESD